jgi:uncharacterized membrane protein
MGITLLNFGGLFAPLQQFIGWLTTAPQRAPVQQVRPPQDARRRSSCAAALPARRPLRVVRVVDGCRTPAGAGRMVISGRMADVCAELDRLAALEAERG